MKISVRWLREFVDTELDAREQAADRLTNAGHRGGSGSTPVVPGLAGVVVGEIEAIERELGESAATGSPARAAWHCRTPLSVVCGAPNAAPGAARGRSRRRARRCPAAAHRPPPRSAATQSEGMLCSERELGSARSTRRPARADAARRSARRSRDPSASTTPSSRSRSPRTAPTRCPSLGVARELAALTGAPLSAAAVGHAQEPEVPSALAAVAIDAPDLCPRRAA